MRKVHLQRGFSSFSGNTTPPSGSDPQIECVMGGLEQLHQIQERFDFYHCRPSLKHEFGFNDPQAEYNFRRELRNFTTILERYIAGEPNAYTFVTMRGNATLGSLAAMCTRSKDERIKAFTDEKIALGTDKEIGRIFGEEVTPKEINGQDFDPETGKAYLIDRMTAYRSAPTLQASLEQIEQTFLAAGVTTLEGMAPQRPAVSSRPLGFRAMMEERKNAADSTPPLP